MIMNLQGRSTVNVAADSLSTNMYGRWYTVKYGEGDRRQYIKLHAIVTADTDMPFFIYAKVTDGTASDAAELVCSLTLMSILVKCTLIGNFQ
jgi:hypothetical protein